jgi:hypothetical protein
MTDFRVFPETAVTIPESAVTFDRNSDVFVLELAT